MLLAIILMGAMSPMAKIVTVLLCVGLLLFIVAAFMVRRSGAMALPEAEIIDILQRLNNGEEVLLPTPGKTMLYTYLTRLEIEQQGIRKYIEYAEHSEEQYIIRLSEPMPPSDAAMA